MARYICIHGHFYQPPRENPWLEAIEKQDSAYPYHDWNERITEECYAPNATAHILNEEHCITGIMNNYSKISFNFGPTVLSWLEAYSPEVYQAILQADQDSLEQFGYGNAIAQAYNHMIMPLANDADKYTQIKWGIRDFERRFQRLPLGMWLPETAVDLKVLDLMAESGIQFTILAPHQAKRIRPINEGAQWEDVDHGNIPPTRAYRQNLPSGRSITLFFYDGPVSQSIAFEDLLSRGENLAERIIHTLPPESDEIQLANIATDGETYGHHHRFGDMALAYAMHYIEEKNLAKITNYSQFLNLYPPTYEVEIFENTSWSCMHGVERWKSACGCNSGGHADWNQEWRAPLRASLDWLRDLVAPLYEEKAKDFFNNPWEARNDYIDVILDRSPESLNKFFEKSASHPLTQEERQTAINLLEIQRFAMLMYTSCGWFFDELTGIETVQVIAYASRLIQLAEKTFNISLENDFIERLSEAKSNLAEFQDSRVIYDKYIKPRRVDWNRIAAHYAITSLFENYETEATIYCYKVTQENFQSFTQGASKLAIGYGQFQSIITTESTKLVFVAVHFGDQNITCGISQFQNDEIFNTMKEELIETFNSGNFMLLAQVLNKHFNEATHSINYLFHDKQQGVVNYILEDTLKEIDLTYRQIYQRHASFMHFIEDLGMSLPEIFPSTAKYVLDNEMKEALSQENLDGQQIEQLLNEAKLAKVNLDDDGLTFTLKQSLERLMQSLNEDPLNLDKLEQVNKAIDIATHLPFSVNLYHVQNTYYKLLNSTFQEVKLLADQGDAQSISWIAHFVLLGHHLSICVPEINLPIDKDT